MNFTIRLLVVVALWLSMPRYGNAQIAVRTDSATAPAAQDTVQVRTARNAVYLELLGSGFLGSLNYERIFSEYISIRVGLSYVPVTMINFTLGGSSKFEAGIGMIYFSKEGVKPSITIGYRYQPYAQGFFFRATPVVLYYGKESSFNFAGSGSSSSGTSWQGWLPGISFGYIF